MECARANMIDKCEVIVTATKRWLHPVSTEAVNPSWW